MYKYVQRKKIKIQNSLKNGL